MSIKPNDIKRYLEGNVTAEESEKIRRWLCSPENESDARMILGDLWMNSDISLKVEKPNVEQLYRKTKFRLQNQQSGFQSRRRYSQTKRLFQLTSRIAAILFLPLLLFTTYLYFQPSTSPTTELASNSASGIREIYTKPGTRTSFQLSDGTKVWLNDGTTFRYPEQFTGSNREVFVDGEAYFEVQADQQNPFVVKNPMMNTIVTGTHFNVHAYSKDHFFEATLLEGKIQLESKSGNPKLNAGEQLQFNVDAQTMIQREVKSSNAISWIDGKLMIQNERLDAALKKISRWYNVEIHIADPQLASYELTCTLENEKLEQCMSLIANALQIRYRIEKLDKRKRIHLMK